eukprot:436344-Prorocentrum_minimum.AAC.2
MVPGALAPRAAMPPGGGGRLPRVLRGRHLASGGLRLVWRAPGGGALGGPRGRHGLAGACPVDQSERAAWHRRPIGAGPGGAAGGARPGRGG